MRVEIQRVVFCAAVGCALLGNASTLRAQQPVASVATRALLIEQAERARVAGDHRGALGLAERAGRIEMTTSLRMFLAEEQLATGAAAAAMSSALLCTREATRDMQLPSRDGILARCRELGQQARAVVALVTLRAPPGVAEVRIELDGQPLPAELLDVPQPMDPGEHRVVVRVSGRLPSELVVTARSGEAREVALRAGAEVVVPVAPPPVAPLPAPVAPPPAPVASGGGPGGGAIALLAVGGASIVASAVFFGLRGAAAEGCDTGPDPARGGEQVWRCDTPAQVEAVGARGTWTTLGGVTLGVGVAALGAGIAWWVLGGRRGDTPPRPTAMLLRDGVALGVEGSL
jgi:hypothetical protein